MINCKFRDNCSKKETPQCHKLCPAYVFMHGSTGKGGVWGSRNTPSVYDGCTLANLPSLQPVSTDKVVRKYAGNVVKYVKGSDKTGGLFLYSSPTQDNLFGTGNGKTTSATTILNEYTVARGREHMEGKDKITHKANPSLFIKSADFQNLYNSQFRGTQDMQQDNSNRYQKAKSVMKSVELLVLDDIAIRGCTEAFLSELYEIIDHRVTEGSTTIYTSNIPLDDLTPILGDRITSRIDGGVLAKLPFTGKDNRRGSI